ncbi:MAG: DNA-directed RNA polymerase subunit omega [Verrucomicrobia bacterium]|nr:MAG: DNA-directed RNA polymerase subunit omega [Verrucomicrobiota bacterium]
MNSQILEEAAKVEPEIPVLINIISKRIRQLNAGSRPMVEVHPRMGLADIALAEVAAGRLKAAENHSPENPAEF